MQDRQVSEKDPLDRALRTCDPLGGKSPAHARIGAAFDAMSELIVNEPRQARRQRRLTGRPRAALAGIAASVLLTAGVAVAATNLFVATHTHQYPPKGMIAGGGPGELLNVNGTDFGQVASQISSDIQYPAGYESWRASVVSAEHAQQQGACPPGSPSTCTPKMPSGELRYVFAASAFTAWVLDWRHNMTTGQQAAAANDARVISGALTWPAVTARDPHPSLSVPGDGGTTHPSPFGWAIPFVQAVGAGDLAAVNQAIVNDANLGGQFALWADTGMGVSLSRGLVGQALLTYLNDHGS